MKPTLSIIIVNYNTPKLVSALLRSIKKEGSKISSEIIVIDNGSDIESHKMLKTLHSAGLITYFIENDSNLGFSKANNQGIRKASGKYILLLNSDTEVTKGVFSEIVKFAESKPDSGVIAPKLLNTDGTVQPSCFYFPTIGNAIKEYWLGKRGQFDKYAPKGVNPVEVDAVVGAAFLITPKAKAKVGLLNEKYFMYFEDLDYCRKTHQVGLKVYYYPLAKVIHHHGASGAKLADNENQWKRLIPSSKVYHGLVGHYLLFLVMWIGQKWQKLMKIHE